MKKMMQSMAAVLVLLLAVPVRAADDRGLLKTGYYVALGDSVAAGEGALPVTLGYVYQLYGFGVFGRLPHIHFANIALRGARTWEMLEHQVPQVLCSEPTLRPTVITITVGGNDFFRGDFDIPSIAWRVAESINNLLNNTSATHPVTHQVLDPVTGMPCRAVEGVRILVSNNYAIPHPDPVVAAQYDMALRGFDQALRFWLQPSILHVPEGSKVIYVDVYAATAGRRGLIRGFDGSVPDVYNVHPTNLGHFVIAKAFADAWQAAL